jgi:hypothetical protein
MDAGRSFGVGPLVLGGRFFRCGVISQGERWLYFS